MTEEEKRAAAAAAAEAELQAKIKAMIESELGNALAPHMKKLSAGFEKTLADTVAKITPKAPETPVVPVADGGPAPKADPETIRLREQVEKLTRQSEEDRKSRSETEQKSRLTSTRTELRAALDAKGIKGARATAVLALLESQGAVKFGEDGTPELVIRRARTKGARAEDLSFDDLAAGIEDWAKSADAAEFLPAVQTTAPARRPGASSLAAPARAQSPDGTPSDAQIAAEFSKAGFDLSRL
jgi:hypothetical protein